MKKIVFSLLILPAICHAFYPKFDKLRDGDIMFIQTQNNQSMAIKKTTKSKWTHMGIVFYSAKDKNWYVYEASRTVKKTKLHNFFIRSVGRKYLIVRYPELDKKQQTALKWSAKKHFNKRYDPLFRWDDDKLYCSEYVWKVFKDALKIELGPKHKYSSLDLKNEHVIKLIERRLGEKPIDLNHIIVSPQNIADFKKLEIVQKN